MLFENAPETSSMTVNLGLECHHNTEELSFSPKYKNLMFSSHKQGNRQRGI